MARPLPVLIRNNVTFQPRPCLPCNQQIKERRQGKSDQFLSDSKGCQMSIYKCVGVSRIRLLIRKLAINHVELFSQLKELDVTIVTFTRCVSIERISVILYIILSCNTNIYNFPMNLLQHFKLLEAF